MLLLRLFKPLLLQNRLTLFTALKNWMKHWCGRWIALLVKLNFSLLFFLLVLFHQKLFSRRLKRLQYNVHLNCDKSIILFLLNQLQGAAFKILHILVFDVCNILQYKFEKGLWVLICMLLYFTQLEKLVLQLKFWFIKDPSQIERISLSIHLTFKIRTRIIFYNCQVMIPLQLILHAFLFAF